MAVAAETMDTWKRVTQGRQPQPFAPDIFAPGTDMAIMRSVWSEQVKTDPRVRYGDLRALDAFDAAALVGTIRVPTLVAVGNADAMLPVEGARDLQERIAGARLEVIDGAGHMVANEQPVAFAETLLRFLGQTSRP